MHCGLQVFDANGNLDVDTSTGIAKYLGEFTTGFNSGSFSHPELKNGRFWLINKQSIVDSELHTHIQIPKNPVSGMEETYYVLDFPILQFDYKTGTIRWTYQESITEVTSTVSFKVIDKLRRVSETYIYGVF